MQFNLCRFNSNKKEYLWGGTGWGEYAIYKCNVINGFVVM